MKTIALSLFFCGLLISADDGYLVVHVSPVGPKDKHWRLGLADVNPKGTLPRGADVSGPAGGDLILKCTPTRYYSYSCPKDCTVPVCREHVEGVGVYPIDLHQHTEGKTGFLEGLFAALFVRAPVLPVVAASRAGGNPNDAVVLQRGAEIHLGPALRRVVEDTYCFQLKRLPCPVNFEPSRLRGTVSKDAEGIAQLPNLKPGAYELSQGIRRRQWGLPVGRGWFAGMGSARHGKRIRACEHRLEGLPRLFGGLGEGRCGSLAAAGSTARRAFRNRRFRGRPMSQEGTKGGGRERLLSG